MKITSGRGIMEQMFFLAEKLRKATGESVHAEISVWSFKSQNKKMCATLYQESDLHTSEFFTLTDVANEVERRIANAK